MTTILSQKKLSTIQALKPYYSFNLALDTYLDGVWELPEHRFINEMELEDFCEAWLHPELVVIDHNPGCEPDYPHPRARSRKLSYENKTIYSGQ